jgi:hypothetical protein
MRGKVRAVNREENPAKKRSNSPERQNGRTAELGRYGRKMKSSAAKK